MNDATLRRHCAEQRRRAIVANDRAHVDAVAATQRAAALAAAANDFAIPSPFIVAQKNSLVIPFGKHPHPQGIQLFDRASAEQLRANFAPAPIYKGHVDVVGHPSFNPSSPAVGWVDGIAIENDGIRLAVRWGAEGRRAIENAEFRFYSPFWDCQKVPGGIRPVKLRSVALTNSPRIAVAAIANDAGVPSPQAVQRAAKLTDLRRRLPGVSEATLRTILDIELPADAEIDPATGRLKQNIRGAVERQQAMRDAIAEVMRELAAKYPNASYQARFDMARARVPALFAS